MTTLFSRIIDGEIPAHFVWQDETCVAFLVIDPMTDGHTIVVPRREVDSWLDADADLVTHLTLVAHQIGKAQQAAWSSARVGLLVEGFLVPHLHLHVWPANSVEDFDPHDVTHGQDQKILAANAARLRAALRDQGAGEAVPAEPA
ncbi:histidine triad (HIT) family protein [Branchiibius hedensis]|uniref:Histidine triad (HIT) family protein n=1 Tax=Branchiibius hedensis TaxID=672460 RepID=A0A2Y8ZQ73_9MICO|nr:HIT family protein [Branchiibius hedensis]PWJ24719.1 histidine triad (HIT) family protein [Branchiibius hedensis]SSA33536.1 histidine triad (HIT) family protein [Branchiibius hedensis]